MARRQGELWFNAKATSTRRDAKESRRRCTGGVDKQPLHISPATERSALGFKTEPLTLGQPPISPPGPT